MKRSLLLIFAIVTSLIGVSTSALWIRSYWVEDRIDHLSKNGRLVFFENRGTLGLHRDTISSTKPNWEYVHTTPGPQWDAVADSFKRDIHFLGFRFQQHEGGLKVRNGSNFQIWIPFWRVEIPHASVVIVSAALSIVAIVRLRASPFGKGRCRRCGYDLRATPDRCPECGTVSA